MKNTRQSVAKLLNAISKMDDDGVVGYPIVIAYSCIIKAKSNTAKERLVETAILLTEERVKRNLDTLL